jgi:hypothetical protein
VTSNTECDCHTIKKIFHKPLFFLYPKPTLKSAPFDLHLPKGQVLQKKEMEMLLRSRVLLGEFHARGNATGASWIL